ncbi:MAG: cation transporter, partial [Rubrivivax sp.]
MSDIDTPTDSVCSGSACGPHARPTPAFAPPGAGGTTYRIPTMDCSAEEAEIRRALEPISGISSLGFQLGA